jgi:hypothetical protein
MCGRYYSEGIEPNAFAGWVRPVTARGFTALDIGCAMFAAIRPRLSFSDGCFGVAGKIEKRIKFIPVRLHLRQNPFWNFLFAVCGCGKSRRRALVAAAPNIVA